MRCPQFSHSTGWSNGSSRVLILCLIRYTATEVSSRTIISLEAHCTWFQPDSDLFRLFALAGRRCHHQHCHGSRVDAGHQSGTYHHSFRRPTHCAHVVQTVGPLTRNNCSITCTQISDKRLSPLRLTRNVYLKLAGLTPASLGPPQSNVRGECLTHDQVLSPYSFLHSLKC